MFLDTIHTFDCEIVVIALETEHERQFSMEKLVGIALSQDRLRWEIPDRLDPSVGKAADRLHGQALVTCPDDCQLRAPLPDQMVSVQFVGDATALVMIRAANEQ